MLDRSLVFKTFLKDELIPRQVPSKTPRKTARFLAVLRGARSLARRFQPHGVAG